MAQTTGRTAISIYYLHYGRDEQMARKRHVSAHLLKKSLDDMGYTEPESCPDLSMDLRAEVMQSMSDFMFGDRYAYSPSLNCRSIGIPFRTVSEKGYDKETLRRVYSIVIWRDR